MKMATAVGLCAALSAAGSSAAETLPPDVTVSQNTRTVPAYEVFELQFRHDRVYGSPFFDVTIEVTFTPPAGDPVRVGGFHYGSSVPPRIVVHGQPSPHGEARRAEYKFEKQDLWKARFAPAQTGAWSFAYTFANREGGRASGTGSFVCVRGRRPGHGFVRPNPDNPFRWVFDDGTPYFPIGLQECFGDSSCAGSVLAAMAMEGPFRLDRKGRPDPPPGAMFKPGPSSNPQNGDVYFRRHAQAGFNLIRFSQANASYNLYTDLDHYLVQEGVMTDELLAQARRYGMRVFYGLFGFRQVFNDRPDDAEGMAKVRRFVKYSVDRWGAYVDFWEFLNEQKADAEWYAIMAPYLRSIDPYRHPIATSWERPELEGIEVNAPHWYAGIGGAENADRETAARAQEWKRHGKPVIVGEQGNHASKEQLQTPGIGGVWDAGSSTRMRLRNWTALFHEIAFVFWSTSYARDGHNMNLWIGPQERQYVHAMQDFAARLDARVRMVPVQVSDPKAARAFGLASPERAAVYLHHFTDHRAAVSNLAVTLDVPSAARGYWYAPENAAILGSFAAPAGRQSFVAPPFTVDLALLITQDGPPDTDGDGIANDRDPDDDNDGVPDARDAFPLEAGEWADADGDLIGDQLDADLDADGLGDDRNGNGLPDCGEPDIDGDGVPTAGAVPWDAFPLDPKEWRDTDGDGVGDNADRDKDGDGWNDREERRAGTDPLDRLSFPADRR